jgi:hypothetical protein
LSYTPTCVVDFIMGTLGSQQRGSTANARSPYLKNNFLRLTCSAAYNLLLTAKNQIALTSGDIILLIP